MLVPLRLRAVLTALVVTVGLIGFTAPAAQAAPPVTWTGASSGDWTDADNWAGGDAPLAGDDLVFPAGAGTTTVNNDYASGTEFGSITIEAAGYKLVGNDLTVTGAVSTTFASGAAAVQVGLTLDDGTVTVNSGGRLSLAGPVSGSNGLTFGGGGTLALDAASNPYDGTTTVGPGVLEVNGSINGIVDLDGGTLTGSGTVNDTITGVVPATISPGTANGPGTLTYAAASGVTLRNDWTFHVDIDGTTASSGYDQLRLTNPSAQFNPNGAVLDVELGYIPAIGTSFQIVSQTRSSAITGRFSGLGQSSAFTAGPATFEVEYATSGIILTVVDVTPPTSTWDGGGATSSWTDAANWVDDTAPLPGSKLVFPSGAAQTSADNDFAAGTSFASITVADSGYTLSGNQVALAGALNGDLTSGTSTISSNLALSSAAPVSVQSGGTLELTGVVSGANGLTKSGTGRLSLTRANSYSGVTSVGAGTLVIANGQALGSSSTGNGTTVASGATLELRGNFSTLEPLTITGAGDGGVGALYSGQSSTSVQSAFAVQSVTMTGNSTIGIADGAFMTIASAVGESGGSFTLTKSGAGNLNVQAGVTTSHTGGTAVAAGNLTVQGTVPGAISVASGATLSGTNGTAGDVTSAGGTVVAGFQTTAFQTNVNSLTLDSASTVVANLNGTAVGTGTGVVGYSRLVVAGATTLAGATLTAPIGSSYVPEIGDVLTILTTGGALTGTFKNLPEGASFTTGGYTFRISYLNNAVTLTNVRSSSISLAVSPSPSEQDGAVTLTATLNRRNLNGTVTFKDGSTTLGTTTTIINFRAVLTINNLAVGSHSITATYGGDATTGSSTSAAVTLSVVDSPPNTAITSGPVDGSTGNTPDASFVFGSTATDVASYECSLDGDDFAACTSPQAYTKLAGGSHTFEVRAVDAAGQVDPSPARRTWTVTGVFDVTGEVTVSGTAKVGETLTATSTVVTTPASTSTTGQWFRGATAIDGETGSTYELTNDDVSSVITYVQTNELDDYEPAVTTSNATDPITGGIITLGTPTILGDAVVDQDLTASLGSVNPSDATVVLAWKVGGIATLVTGDTYTVQPGDVGKAVTVVAKATKTDYDDVTEESIATADVVKAAFSTGPTATISGVVQVGETLTAGTGTADPTPTYLYQWFAGGAPIRNATDQTYTLKLVQKGLPITVRVTAVRSGYLNAISTSAPTAAVATNTAPGLSLGISDENVRLGGGLILTWSTSEATSLAAGGAWSGAKATSGEEVVTPNASGVVTYVLTATNAAGSTTAQVAVNVGLPDARLSVKARSTVKVGRKITIKASRLAPGEAYAVYIGGRKLASGTASATGTVKQAVRVPSSVKAGTRTIQVRGSLSDRVGTRKVKVTPRR